METEADGTQHPGGHLPDSAARAEGEAGAEDEDEDVPLAAQRPQLEEGERKRREMIKEKEREREEKLLRNKELGEEEGEVDVWEGVKLVRQVRTIICDISASV
jgi:histone acetyltransferase